MSNGDDKARVCLGMITGVHGLKGEVVIKTYTEVPENICAYGALEDEAGGCHFEIVAHRVTKKGVIARFEDIASREAAEALRGTNLYVPRDRLDEPEPEAWYQSDLIGLSVASNSGVVLGEIVAVENFGAGDLLEIAPSQSRNTVYLPFTSAYVPEVDIAAGKVIIVPPDGLFKDETAAGLEATKVPISPPKR